MNITLETAKLAKEKGCNIPASHYYIDNFSTFTQDGILYKNNDENLNDNTFSFRKISKGQPHLISAPTQSDLQKWLRDEYDIHIMIGKSFKCYILEYIVQYNEDEDGNDIKVKHDFIDYETYEDVLEQSLIKALEIL